MCCLCEQESFSFMPAAWSDCACVYKTKFVMSFLPPRQAMWFLLGNENHDGSKGRLSTLVLAPWMLSFRMEYSKHLPRGNFDIREMSRDGRFRYFLCGKQQVPFLQSDLESASSMLAKCTLMYYAMKVDHVNDDRCVQTFAPLCCRDWQLQLGHPTDVCYITD